MIKTQFTAVTIDRFIKLKFGDNQAEFARAMSVTPQAVTKWINGKWIVANGQLYSPTRENDALN
jgi:hypothetical protein